MSLPTLPADKANHTLYGAVIFSGAAAASHPLGLGAYALLLGIVAAVLLGSLKEWLDWRANQRAAAAGLGPAHSVEVNDAMATLAGALLCAVAVLAVAG